MRISDWSSDVCSSDLFAEDLEVDAVIVAPAPRSCVGDVFQIDGVVIGDPKAAAHDRPVLGELQRETPDLEPRDRKSVVQGKSVSVRVDLGGRRIIKKKK